MPDAAPAVPEVLRDKRQIEEKDDFPFACHPGVPCFNRCCADVNIVLTPLDVLRLARHLGVTTTEFLREYCLHPITKDLSLPVVVLRMGEDAAQKCRFVGEEGCTVYEDRPWACRMYPVGMAIPPARAGVDPEPVFFLFEDDYCEGRRASQRWTVAEWRADQKVPEREALEAGFREIVAHPWFIGGRRLDERRIEMFHMACYDLDRFRRFVFDSSFLRRFELAPELVERIRADDEALLQFALRWLRYAIFAEPTVTVREDAPSSTGK
ncbi:MAG: YkgJ family cysteine cluster protein [Planctomycetota bacterium]|jgi:Fe-S-cluster containining protein